MVHDISIKNVQNIVGVNTLVTRISPNAVHALQTEIENYILKYLASRHTIARDTNYT